MPFITFTDNLQRHIDCPSQQVAGESVMDALNNYFQQFPKVRSYVLDDQDRLRKHMQIAVNSEIVSDRITLLDSVNDEDEIFIVQALSGG